MDHEACDERPVPEALATIREEIDRIDVRLLDLIAARVGLAVSTLEIKSTTGLLATDIRREAAVVRRGAGLARERGLDPELVRDILWRVIELSRSAYGVESRDRK